MSHINRQKLDQLAQRIRAIVESKTGAAGAYAEEFARYTAGYIASLLQHPGEDPLGRLEAYALTVSETIDEIGDQAAADIVAEIKQGVEWALTVLAVVA